MTTAKLFDLESLAIADLAGDAVALEILQGDLPGWLGALERMRRDLQDQLTLLKPERERYIEDRVARQRHIERCERTKADLVLRERSIADRARVVRELIRSGPITTSAEALYALRHALGEAVTAVNALIALHSPAVCKRCHLDYPRGELDAHLRICSASATAELGRTKSAPVAKSERSTSDIVITITIAGSPRQIEDALRKLRA